MFLRCATELTRAGAFLFLCFAPACDRGPTPEPRKPAVSAEQRPEELELQPAKEPSSSAQPTPSATPESTAKPATASADPILFELKKGDKSSFVFGTMHMGTDVEKDLNHVVIDSFDRSPRAAFEIDLDAVDIMAAAKDMMLPAGKSAKDGLTEKQWKTLVETVGSFLMPSSSLERMKPWALSTLISQKFLPKTRAMDQVLLERARQQKKKLYFLETAKEQMSLLDQVFDSAALADMLDDLDKTERNLSDLASAYRGGDLPAFEKVVFDPVEMKKHPPMFNILLFKRNDAWIPKLRTPFDDGGVFVAVGAAHVVGERGIVKLLEKEGFSVVQVKALR